MITLLKTILSGKGVATLDLCDVRYSWMREHVPRDASQDSILRFGSPVHLGGFALTHQCYEGMTYETHAPQKTQFENSTRYNKS